ncbi:SLC13 family permease [Tropicimonas aquimaris]|uniref:SLC13 family permease n=1 Tax=Tropicimonas aquimaris TaxID=914152 RepID=A0ABW3IM88_9RHOB
MTPEIAFVLVLFVAAAILLATERIPPDAVALLLLVLLVASGIMDVTSALQGLASEAILILACVMVLSRRLSDSGIMSRLTTRLAGSSGRSPRGIMVRLMLASAGLSTVVSNTSTTAVMMPLAQDAARRAKCRPGLLLMPMAFASILGGSATLIGTSTNLAASSVVTRLGLEPFGLFEFFWVGLAVTLAGVTLMALLGDRLIAAEPGDAADAPPEPLFMATIAIDEAVVGDGKALSELGLEELGVTPLAVDTSKGRVAAHPRRKLHAGDRVIVHADAEALAHLTGSGRFSLFGIGAKPPGRQFAQAVLLPGSHWIGASVARMRQEIGDDITVVGLRRLGTEQVARIGRMRLRVGDILLLAGTGQAVERVRADIDIHLLSPDAPPRPTRREGLFTLGAMLSAILLGATGVLPLGIALLAAVLGLVLTDRFSTQDVFGMISWRVLILIGGMSSFGAAMLETGTAEWLAHLILDWVAPFGMTAVLLTLSLLTVVLTQPMSNAAAALTILPIALALAPTLGVDPRPLAVVVTLSASLSFIAPLEPALLLVYGQSRYRLLDFVRAGLPLTALSVLIVVGLVPRIWPL